MLVLHVHNALQMLKVRTFVTRITIISFVHSCMYSDKWKNVIQKGNVVKKKLTFRNCKRL